MNDLTCICENPTFLSAVGNCEVGNCNSAELESRSSLTCPRRSRPIHDIPLTGSTAITAFSQKLCKPAGGIPPAFTSNFTVPSSTGRVPPLATSFTGEAAMVRLPVLDYVVGVLVCIIWTV